MSLNFDLKKIENWEVVCYDYPNIPYEEWKADKTAGTRTLKPVTEHLIWSTMSVELHAISDTNVGEFWARLSLLYGLGRSTHIYGNGEPVRATMDDVIEHIGLGTNASQATRHSWLNRKGGFVQGSMDELSMQTTGTTV